MDIAERNALVEWASGQPTAVLHHVLLGVLNRINSYAKDSFVSEVESRRVFASGVASGSDIEFLIASKRAGNRNADKQAAIAEVADGAQVVARILEAPAANGIGNAEFRYKLSTAARRQAEELAIVLNARPVRGGVSTAEFQRWQEVIDECGQQLADSLPLLDEGVLPEPADAATDGKSRAATINEKMLRTMQVNQDSHGWSAKKWAEQLGYAKSSVAETDAWKTLQKMKDAAKLAAGATPEDRRRGRK